ncbi:MAG: hypothetical protein GY820_31285 [Gammaproteobacteria bacterium]|nr:hypothetical protein [Gammaproteobacteria bacterium]
MDTRPRPLNPYSINLVLGRSQAGKTTLLNGILKDFERLYSCKIKRLLLAFTSYQPVYQEIQNRLEPNVSVQLFPKGLTEELFSAKAQQRPNGGGEDEEGCTVIVIDDCLRQMMGHALEPQLTQLATVDVHHQRLCVFMLLQLASFKHTALQHVWSNAQYVYLPLHSAKVPTVLCQNLQVGKKSI